MRLKTPETAAQITGQLTATHAFKISIQPNETKKKHFIQISTTT
jgi:hypothetical protein